MGINIDLRQVIYALTDALDLVGVDEVGHGKRVAAMALECGRALGWPAGALERLFHAGLLHDCGVTSTRVHRRLIQELDWQGAQTHGVVGCRLLRGFAPFAELAPVVLHHHTHWDDLAGMDVDREVALASNLIFLVDRVDALAAPHYGHDLLLVRERVRDNVSALAGSFFAPRLVRAFLAVSRCEAFWLTLEPRYLERYLQDLEADRRPLYIGFPELRQVAGLFARIVDAKSPFTVEHSLGVAGIAGLLAEAMGLPADALEKIEVTGLLHDLGKLGVPDEVLDKPGPLTAAERAVMQRHSFESYQILRRIPGLDDIARWAGQHHECPNGQGYPFRLAGQALELPARIIAVADVFQALAQHRPYRRALPTGEILTRLGELAEEGRLDARGVAVLRAHLDGVLAAAHGSGKMGPPAAECPDDSGPPRAAACG
jgi:putative nucleotidyltransferase with HDIG domain